MTYYFLMQGTIDKTRQAYDSTEKKTKGNYKFTSNTLQIPTSQ